MSEWRKSPTVALTLIALFLAIQLIIPITRLGEHENTQRFGWQMFSSIEGHPEFTVHTRESTQRVDLSDILARVRDELSLEQEVPAHLCATVPDAVTVTWDDGELPC